MNLKNSKVQYNYRQKQQTLDFNQNLFNILARCQMKPQITQAQIRNMIQIIVNSILEMKQEKQQNLPKEGVNKISIQNYQALIEGIKKQKESNGDNQLIQILNQKFQLAIKQINTKFKELENKFEVQHKLFCQRIQNQSYQLEKRIYQKFKYLFQQTNKKVDIINENKPKSSYNVAQKIRQQNHNKRKKNSLFQSLRKISLHQQRYLSQNRKSFQGNDFRQVMYEEESFIQSDANYQNSYSLVEKQSSLENVQSFMSTQKITFVNETLKPMIKPLQINIKVQGVKRSCKIKIQTTRMWIAIGVLDISYAQKPIKQIGDRCVYYCNDKQVWDGRKTSYNEGVGFVTGDTVQISYDLVTKIVQWKVKKKLRHSLKFSPLSFRDNWVPFVYLFNKNDSVSVVPYEK